MQRFTPGQTVADVSRVFSQRWNIYITDHPLRLGDQHGKGRTKRLGESEVEEN